MLLRPLICWSWHNAEGGSSFLMNEEKGWILESDITLVYGVQDRFKFQQHLCRWVFSCSCHLCSDQAKSPNCQVKTSSVISTNSLEHLWWLSWCFDSPPLGISTNFSGSSTNQNFPCFLLFPCPWILSADLDPVCKQKIQQKSQFLTLYLCWMPVDLTKDA